MPSAYCSLADVAERLRVDLDAQPPDPDAEWLTSSWLTACERIDLYFARTPIVIPYAEGLRHAAIRLSVAYYRQKDHASDVSEEWAEVVPVRAARDPFLEVVRDLAPYRSGAEWAPA